MDPNRCDDWKPDGLKSEQAKINKLVTLLGGAWKGKAIDKIERYDDVVLDGVAYHGWALWLDNGPETASPNET